MISENEDGGLFIEDGRSEPIKVAEVKPFGGVVVKRHRRALPRRKEPE